MKKSIIIFASLLIAIAVVVLVFTTDADYEKADLKTKNLKSYEVSMSTIVNITENDTQKQSVIDQIISVENYGKSSMKYNVTANSTSTDASGNVTKEASVYTYYNDNYYIALPGIKYKSYCGFDAAKSNIDNLVNAVSFPYDKMYNTEVFKEDGKTYYVYDVEHKDVSNHVITALQAAVNNFEGVNFRAADVSAEAVIDNGYITQRSLFVTYLSDNGVEIALEVIWELSEKEASVETPDESKYASL